MSQELDAERYWLGKLSDCLAEELGDEIRQEVMAGSESLTAESPRQEVIEWTRQAMARLDAIAEEEARIEIMTRCACQYPKADLQEIRHVWAETSDLDLVHGMLQARFEAFLKDGLQLDEALIADVVARGWGLAGIRQGNTIIATKIPKSGYLVEYLNESDPEVRRQYYCHCPRVRDLLKTSDTISPTFCYCGAGYYKGIWEEILQQPVEVELLESVLQGDDVCKVAIHLPL
jgi:hypothetical protein